MGKHPYMKATGISFVLHIALLACFTIVLKQFTPASVAAPIAIDFVPATVADTGDTLNQLSSAAAVQEVSRQQEQQMLAEPAEKKQQSKLVQNRQRQEQLSETSSASAVVANAAAALPDRPDGGGGSTAVAADGEGNKPANKPAIRTQAGLVSGSRPAYPRDAWKAGWEGVVIVRVLVGTDGSALSISVQHSSGYASLDAAAAQAVGQWRFSPARSGAAAVESFYDVKVKFRLADGK